MKLKEIILEVLRKRKNQELIKKATWGTPNGLFDLRCQVVDIYKHQFKYESHINATFVEEQIMEVIRSGEYYKEKIEEG